MPLIFKNRVVCVVDIDSPLLNRFDAEDQAGIEQLVNTFLELTDLSQLNNAAAM